MVHASLRRVLWMWFIPALQLVLFLADVGSMLPMRYFLIDTVVINLGLTASRTHPTRISAAPLGGSTTFPVAFQHEGCARMSTSSSLCF